MAHAVLDGQMSLGLRQVEEGLLTLRKGAYFTEDEWIKLDGLIHKGRYVFTTGPPKIALAGSPHPRYAELDNAKGVMSIETIEPLIADSRRGSLAGSRSDSHSPSQNFQAVSDSLQYMETELVTLEDSITEESRDNATERVTPVEVTVHENLNFAEVPRPPSVISNGSNTSQKRLTSKLPAPPAPPAAPKPHHPVKPVSPTPSNKSAKLAQVAEGKTFVVRIPISSIKPNRLEVAAGDKVKVLHEVAGLFYSCVNLRTKASGLLKANYVLIELGMAVKSAKKAAQAATVSKEINWKVGGKTTQKSRAVYELDNIEETSAAEWEEDGPSRTEDLSEQPESGGADHDTSILDRSIQPVTFEDMERFFDSKVSNLAQAGREKAWDSRFPNFLRPNNPRSESKSSRPRPICAAWADPGRTCQYTDETCPNLHALTPWPRRGTSSSPRSAVSPSLSHKGLSVQTRSPRPTCRWWANGKGCRYTADECTHLHGYAESPRHASAPDEATADKEITVDYWAAPGSGWEASSAVEHW